jgi:hypothetical protein
MKAVLRLAIVACALALAIPAVATDFEPDTDGPWINVDVVDLKDYGDATYLEYLGRGYVAMLDALKSEGFILDYGVMMKTTGDASEGDVVIWWSIKTLADYEKAFERMESLSGELHTAEEWGVIWTELQKVRTIRSTNLYRQVMWTTSDD